MFDINEFIMANVIAKQSPALRAYIKRVKQYYFNRKVNREVDKVLHRVLEDAICNLKFTSTEIIPNDVIYIVADIVRYYDFKVKIIEVYQGAKYLSIEI